MSSSQAGPKHHTIVVLESELVGLPQELDLPKSTYRIVSYPRTAPEDIAVRINDATIVVAVTLKLDAHVLSEEVSPKLQLIDYVASGTDGVDKQACKKRDILVCNASGASAAAVSEHAIGLYFALRRRILPTHEAVQAGNWTERSVLNGMMRDRAGELPLSCKKEVLGIIGQGVIGKRIVELARTLNMDVLIAERKGVEACRDGRTSFEEVLRHSTVLVIIVPRTADTVNMISLKELEWMRHDAILVNVSRGDIIDEPALLEALKKGWIGGAAVDVFAEEPATEDNCWLVGNIVKGLNLITTPHTAWAGMATEVELRRMAKENVENWIRGEPRNVVL